MRRMRGLLTRHDRHGEDIVGGAVADWRGLKRMQEAEDKESAAEGKRLGIKLA